MSSYRLSGDIHAQIKPKIFKFFAISFFSIIILLNGAGDASAATNFTFTGYTFDVNGTPLNNTNVTVSIYRFGGGGPPQVIGSYINFSNATGFFNLSLPANFTYFYKATLRYYNDSRIVYIGQSLPAFPYMEFSRLGTVKFFLREAATLNITAFGPEKELQTALSGISVSLPNYTTGLVWVSEGGTWSYINGSGYLVNYSADFTYLGASLQPINMPGLNALYYNGSDIFYAANTTNVLEFYSNGTPIQLYDISGIGYNIVEGLEYYNGSFYISGAKAGNPLIGVFNASFDNVQNITGGIPWGKLERYNGRWFMAYDAGGGNYKLQEYSNSWVPLWSSWSLSKSVGGLAYNGSNWFYASPSDNTTNEVITTDKGVKSFMYMVKDTKLGYPIKEEFNEFVNQSTVYVPAGRNYSIMLYPDMQMPVSYDLNNISNYSSTYGFAPLINITFNLTESLRWVHGYVNYNGGTNFSYLRVVPYLLEPGGMVFKSHPMPYNMSAWRTPFGTQSDSYNASTGFYNITLIGSAMGADMLLFFTARNGSNYYGGFQNLTLNASSDDVVLNVSLQPLLGDPANITMDNGADFQQKINITTAMRKFRLQNSTGSAPNNAHMEFNLDYSSMFNVTSFSWMLDLQRSSDGNFTLPVIQYKVDKINVFSPDFAPLKTSLTANELLGDPVLINLSSFRPGGINGTFTDLAINMFRSNSTCDVPYPPKGCALLPADKGLDEFNPLTVVIGGGDISFRMKKLSNNITVHYNLVDLLASGPPDAVFDGNASTAQVGNALAEAWRFGSTGPEIYDSIIVGMPYNESVTPDTYEFNITIGAFYDEDWNVIWNISENTTSEIPSDYQDYLQPQYAAYVNGSGMKCSQTNVTSTCYVNTTYNMVWIRIPHFSGVGPQVQGSDIEAPNVTFSSPSNTTLYNSSVYLNLSRSDDTGINTTLYSVDGGGNQSYTAPVWITGLGNGTHNIEVFTNDSAGNMNITRVYFSLDYVNESVTNQALNASANWSNVSTSLVFINLTTSLALVGSVNISTYAAPPPEVNESLPVQRYLEINVSDNLNASSGNLTWVYIRVNYSDSDVSGLDESTLRLYWWNPTAKNWTRLETGTNLSALNGPYVYDSGVNTSANYVYANVSHLSIYGISGSTPTTTTTTGGGGGGGGGGVSTNTSDLAYFKEIFKYNTLILVPDSNVSEDWEAAMLIKKWFANRSYTAEVKLVSEFDKIRDEDKYKIFIGGHVANPYSKDIGIDAYFTRAAENKPWLINGEAGKGIIKLYDTDPLSITGRGRVLVIAGADRNQTLRITKELLKEVESQESLSAKANIGGQLIL